MTFIWPRHISPSQTSGSVHPSPGKMTTPVTTSIHIERRRREIYQTRPLFYTHICTLLKALNLNPNVHDVDIYFQPTHDLSELSKLQLLVSRTTDDQHDQHSIDLLTLQVSDAEHGSRDVPVEGTHGAMQLRKYANGVFKKAQNFKDRLIKYGVVTDSTTFLQVDLFSCPLCHRRLETCIDCRAMVACPNGICPAVVATEGEWCDDQPTTLCCRQCLDTKGLDAALVRCPTCRAWRYSSSMDWCYGQIILPTEDQSGLPESERLATKRSHPQKPGPCGFCVETGTAQKWRHCDGDLNICPSKPRSPSRRRGTSTYCTECAAGMQGRGCECGLKWTCNVCSENLKCTIPLYVVCPRCGRTFCRQYYEGCKYCQLCSTCHKPRLCDDCLEEEAIVGEDQESAATFIERCEQCKGPICDACSPRTLKCPFCKERVCGRCTDPSHCPDCKVPMCMRCSEFMCDTESLWRCPPKPGEVQETVSTNQKG